MGVGCREKKKRKEADMLQHRRREEMLISWFR